MVCAKNKLRLGVPAGLCWAVFLVARSSSVAGGQQSGEGAAESLAPQGIEVLGLAGLLAQAQADAVQGRHARALEGIVGVLESYPNCDWDRDDYWQTLVRGFEWFGRLSEPERDLLLAKYTNPRSGRGKTDAPLFNQLTDWMHDVLPGVALQSPGGKLTLAGWHWQKGNYAAAAALAMGVIQTAPDSLAAEYGAMALVLSRIYQHQFDAASEDVRLIGSLMPNSRAAGWAVAQLNWWHAQQKNADWGRRLNQRIIDRSPGTLVADVAGRTLTLMNAIDAGDYARAIDLLEHLRPYNHLTEPRAIVGAFTQHLDWTQRRSEAFKVQVQDLEDTGLRIATGGRSAFQRKFARVLLGSIYQRQFKTDQAVAVLSPFLPEEQGDEDFELRAHALGMLGVMLFKTNPPKAIEALEAFAEDYSELPFSDNAVLVLGGLYLKAKRYDDALRTFTWADNRLKSGVSLWPAPQERVTAGLAGALLGLGRVAEAWATIRPVVRNMPPERLRANLRVLTNAGFKVQAEAAREQLAKEHRLDE